jgi:hypothetical protein
MDKPAGFNSLFDALQAASYLDTLRHAEHQWIQRRLSWLLISQSFCITSYVVVSIGAAERALEPRRVLILRMRLPRFGVTSCVTSRALAAPRRRAAQRRALHRRERPLNIPEDGANGAPRVGAWICWAGELPHRVLPWILAAVRLLQLFG